MHSVNGLKRDETGLCEEIKVVIDDGHPIADDGERYKYVGETKVLGWGHDEEAWDEYKSPYLRDDIVTPSILVLRRYTARKGL